MASCVLITKWCVAAKHLLQFNTSAPKAKSRCVSLTCSASSPVQRSSSPPDARPSQQRGPRRLQPWLGTAGASFQGQQGHATCTGLEKCSPWTPLPSSFWRQGLLRNTFGARHIQTPTWVTPLLIAMTASTHGAGNLYHLPPTPVNSQKRESSSAFGACFLYILTEQGNGKITNAWKNKRDHR